MGPLDWLMLRAKEGTAEGVRTLVEAVTMSGSMVHSTVPLRNVVAGTTLVLLRCGVGGYNGPIEERDQGEVFDSLKSEFGTYFVVRPGSLVPARGGGVKYQGQRLKAV